MAGLGHRTACRRRGNCGDISIEPVPVGPYKLGEAESLRKCVRWRRVAGAIPCLVCEQRLQENVRLHAYLEQEEQRRSDYRVLARRRYRPDCTEMQIAPYDSGDDLPPSPRMIKQGIRRYTSLFLVR